MYGVLSTGSRYGMVWCGMVGIDRPLFGCGNTYVHSMHNHDGVVCCMYMYGYHACDGGACMWKVAPHLWK